MFLPVISHDALNSTACQREFDWADALHKPVLPVAVEPPSKALPARISLLQVVDYSDPAQRERAALTLAGALSTVPAAPPLPKPMPAAPAPPLSYLTDLVEMVSGQSQLDHEQQRQILVRLESALRSVDPHERQGGLDILERFSTRENLYADVDRRLTWLKANTSPGVRGTEARDTSGPAPVPSASAPRLPRRRAHSTSSVGQTPSSVPPPPPADARGSASRVTQPVPRKRSKVKPALIATAVVVLVAAGTTGYLMWPQGGPSQSPTARSTTPTGQGIQGTPSASPAGQGAPSASPGGRTTAAASPGEQTVLPFTSLNQAGGVALDAEGDVYVVDHVTISELAAGASTSVQLPTTGIGTPVDVAVDTAGTVYVADVTRNAVWQLPANATAPTIVPLTGLKCGEYDSNVSNPTGVTVDGAGAIYVADGACQNRVLMLAAGSSAPTVLPFTGLNVLGAVAVDTAGNVYVADGVNSPDARVLKLAPGSTRPMALPFTDLSNPQGLAVDDSGNLYVSNTGKKRVLKLAAGSDTPTELPFTDLKDPKGLAVDGAGNVYVSDGNRVLKLAAG